MSNQTWGIGIGGLLPALLFALSNVFARPASASGIGLGLYIVIVGLAITLIGAIMFMLQPVNTITFTGGLYAAAVGCFWALGAAGVAYALSHYQVTLSRLVALFNMNTLITVLTSLWVFSEWKDGNSIRLLAGTALNVTGGTLVHKA
mgnify:CR=1 FL=1